jgi:hypothetical protein
MAMSKGKSCDVACDPVSDTSKGRRIREYYQQVKDKSDK